MDSSVTSALVADASDSDHAPPVLVLEWNHREHSGRSEAPVERCVVGLVLSKLHVSEHPPAVIAVCFEFDACGLARRAPHAIATDDIVEPMRGVVPVRVFDDDRDAISVLLEAPEASAPLDLHALAAEFTDERALDIAL